MIAPLAPPAVVGIAGAGAMGAGIAEVAALAGHPVRLFDPAPGAAETARGRIARSLAARAGKGKIAATEAEAAARRIAVVGALPELAGAALVLEAAPEDAGAKRELLAALETAVGESAIIASNTSSLSISALARGLKNPGRFAGMHFFNPAPAMALVEIVRGDATAESAAALLFATAEAWGKTPVLVRDAPGFIVNRVARPFYLEALSLYENHAADPAIVDAVVCDSGGFRMGPFELMDLIGHDVNAAVTRAVFEAFGRDPRFQPSRAQAELVASGRLGRKSGQGIYDHRSGAARPAPRELPPGPRPSRVTVEGDLGPAESLAGAIRTSAIPCARASGEGRIVLDGAVLMLTDGRSAARRVAEGAPADLVLFDLALDYGCAPRIGLAAGASTPASALAAAAGLIQALGKKASPLPDAPALAVLRIVARLANEAASLVADGIADGHAVDTAMRAGANYPLGPLAWASTIGPGRVRTALEALAEAEGAARYRSLVRPRDFAAITQA
jgi:3-hydroxybutyryl-CoA dehydrogenase